MIATTHTEELPTPESHVDFLKHEESPKDSEPELEDSLCQKGKTLKLSSCCRTYSGQVRKNVFKSLVRAFLKDYHNNKAKYQEQLRATFVDCNEEILATLDAKLEACDAAEKRRDNTGLKKDYKSVINILGERKHYLYILSQVLNKLLDKKLTTNYSRTKSNHTVYRTTFQELNREAKRRLRHIFAHDEEPHNLSIQATSSTPPCPPSQPN